MQRVLCIFSYLTVRLKQQGECVPLGVLRCLPDTSWTLNPIESELDYLLDLPQIWQRLWWLSELYRVFRLPDSSEWLAYCNLNLRPKRCEHECRCDRTYQEGLASSRDLYRLSRVPKEPLQENPREIVPYAERRLQISWLERQRFHQCLRLAGHASWEQKRVLLSCRALSRSWTYPYPLRQEERSRRIKLCLKRNNPMVLYRDDDPSASAWLPIERAGSEP